ncbi:sensor histidine kinase [Actinoplanes sp. NPDC049265]|uniref:sensor histidine kinase n=1 Tax=Actinoplanes sp. NPDC049265 TaxID=3363902 RepID=UPI00371EF0BB
MSRPVPARRSLLVKLLATSLLIAVCSIAATAWLAVQLTKQAVTQEQSRTLSADTDIYDALIEYAATHDSWAGAQAKVARLADLTGARIALTTPGRRPIAGFPADALDAAAVSDVPTATVDPLFLDPGIARNTGGRIDARAVGPYRLTEDERRSLRRDASSYVDCLRSFHAAAEIVDTPSGRPVVRRLSAAPPAATRCDRLDRGFTPVGSERKPLAALNRLVRSCAGDDFSLTPLFDVRYSGAPDSDREQQVDNCVGESRRAQLRPYVAPPALLFVTGRAMPAPSVDLSPGNQLRIAGTTGIVLVLAVIATVVVGRRLVRPLRALTEAARQPVDRQGAVPVTTHDEIGHLATAFNDLSARREALEQQRQDMVNDIAHELRTPLTNIRTWLETARDGAVDLGPEVLDLLVEESILLHHVVDDLRDIAAADAGSLRIHREHAYIHDLLSGRPGVELTADPDLMAYVDPVRMRQMVGNLVSNALRHTPPGGRVTIDAGVTAGRLTIRVTDTGSGIAPADLPRIFDRFWRADSSRSRATGGSGLGLPIARRLARAHGGDITVTSTPGAGSTFTIDVPA